MRHRSEIDGLRALAVLSVMLFHARFSIVRGGFIGVDIFFVISGYLITSLIDGDLEKQSFSLADFYARRIRRIFPALFVTLAASAAIAAFVLSPTALAEFGGHLIAAAASVANLTYFAEAGYFATKAEYLPLIHTWSLSVEEQFYLLFPLYFAFVRGRAGRMGAALVTTALAIASLILANGLSQTSLHRDAAFFLLTSRAWELGAGAVLALAERQFPRWAQLRDGDTWPINLAGALSLAICVGSVAAFRDDMAHPGFITAVPIAATCGVLAFASQANIVGRLMAWRPIAFVGVISYSAYLFDQPLLAFLRIRLARDLAVSESLAVTAAALALGAISWRWIEQPFRSRAGVSTAAAYRAFAAGTAAIGAVGLAYLATDGLPGRVSPQINAALRSLEEGRAARWINIRRGKCHFNESAVPFDQFFAEWDCMPRSKPRILTLGDSMSADKSWVLRDAGFDVGNLGGAGCPIIPPPSAAEPCAQIISRGRDLLRNHAIDGLVLAENRRVATPEVLQAIVDYWGALAPKILIFTGMPPFENLKDRIPLFINQGTPLQDMAYDAQSVSANEAALESLRRFGFTIVESRRLLCGEPAAPCGPFIGDRPRVIDATHLAPLGAALMAERIKTDPTWLGWVTSLLTDDAASPAKP